MSTGIDAIGLALAVFPIVIELVDWYGGRMKSHDTNFLAESLHNTKQLFDNTIKALLHSVVPAEELKPLLENPGGDAWKDVDLDTKVTEHLGADADAILKKIEEIYLSLAKLKEKLPVVDPSKIDKKGLHRAKHVIKCFIQNPRHKSNLDVLKIRIREFRELTKDALELTPRREPIPTALKHLDVVQEYASGLHDALQAGWNCDLDHHHPANIKLEVWSSNANESTTQKKAPEIENILRLMKFSFLFADRVESVQSDHWVEAEITPLNTSPALGPTNGLSSSPVSIQRPMSGLTLSTSPTNSDSTVTSSDDNQDSPGDKIHDLCRVLSNRSRHRVGSISDKHGHCYDCFIKPEQLPQTPARSSVKLDELFNLKNKLTTKNRVQLALELAWGVLQISSTSWLSGQWTKENIMFVQDSPDNRSTYVRHRFQSMRRLSTSSTMAPETSNDIAAWVSHASLFALGVFLLEVCHNSSIEDLAVEEEKFQGKPTPTTPFLTALRLSKTVHEYLGCHYSAAVRACLQLPNVDIDASGKPKDPQQFAKHIYRNIIEPLRTLEDTFKVL